MKITKPSLKSKINLILGVIVGLVVGGIATVGVMAAIPDNSGVIHGCYKNSNGSLKVIDSPSDTCASGETALNWNQTGPQSGGLVLHDANNQTLGDMMSESGNSPHEVVVYNHTLNRIIKLAAISSTDYMDVGQLIVPFFESNDCSGQAYVGNNTNEGQIKTNLLRWNDGSTDHYATVATSATNVNISYNSINSGNNCLEASGQADLYPLTSATLPFNTPVNNPLKF